MEIEMMREHLGDLSIFAKPAPVLALVLILGVDLVLTLVHSIQELKGRLWRYFGAIAGVAIPDVLGFLFFFVGLTGGLWALAVVGIAGWFPVVGEIRTEVAVGAIGFLIGGRLSDSWFSHIRLARKGYRPNPGLTSTPFYIVEAFALLLLFAPGLWVHTIPAVVGLGLGGLFFFSVLPLLRFLRTLPVVRRLRREPWRSGDPAPAWVYS